VRRAYRGVINLHHTWNIGVFTSLGLMLYFALQVYAVQTQFGVNTTAPFTHEALDEVLQEFVDTDGFVDFALLKLNPSVLNTYIRRIGEVSPETHPQLFPTWQHHVAYWCNAYQALALRYTLDHYPTEKAYLLPTQLVAKHRRYTLGGTFYTLSGIQLKLQSLEAHARQPLSRLLPTLRLDGPPMPRQAYHPQLLVTQLRAQAQRPSAYQSLLHQPIAQCNAWLLQPPLSRIQSQQPTTGSLYFPPKAIQTLALRYPEGEKPIYRFCGQPDADTLPPTFLLMDVWQIREMTPH
jgi:hypothetical protein